MIANIVLISDARTEMKSQLSENGCKYMGKELLDEFIAFAKAEYGLTIEVVKSDTPDSFEKIFGISTF